jgi:putative transposase
VPANTEIYIYFTFTPKYRKELLTDAVKDTVDWSIRDQAGQMSIKVLALNIKSDHLHLIVQLPPDISVSKAAGMLKWRSSIVARQRHPELQEIKAFWGRRYFARSISPMNLEQAKQFVESR